MCSRFQEDVLRIGHVFLCRSCVCLYTGLLSVALFCFFIGISNKVASVFLVVLLIPTLCGSMPRHYKRFPRCCRDVLRIAVGACLALCANLLLQAQLWLSVPVVFVLFVTWKIYRSQRAVRKAHACDSCHEMNSRGVCRGFIQQAHAVRLYEERATRRLYQSGRAEYTPKMPI